MVPVTNIEEQYRQMEQNTMRRVRKILKTKLNGGNIVTRINT